MTKEDFSRLVQKYLDGRASDEEVALMEKFYKYFQDREPGWEGWAPEEKSQLEDHLLLRINRKLEVQRKRKSRKRVYLISSVAAAILLLIAGYWIFDKSVENSVDHISKKEITISANSGAKSVFLKDGTYILLKEGARVTYRDPFEKEVRRVRLEGEAWFDVKRDTTRPFIVHSHSVITTVLGTSFTIRADPMENDVKVSVTSGRVKVSDANKELGILTKDEELSYDIHSGDFHRSTLVDKEKGESLKPVEYRMADVSMEEATEFLGERFDKEIVFENKDLKECRLYASFDKEDTLDDILIIICGISNSRFKKEGQRIVISGEGCNNNGK